MDAQTIIQFIFPMLTFVTVGACILLFSMTTTLRQSNTDLRDRVTDVEAENKRHEATIKSQAEKIDAQSEEIALWAKTVTGEVHLVAITDLLTHHHDQAVKVWEQWGVRLDHVDTGIDGVRVLLARLVELEERKP